MTENIAITICICTFRRTHIADTLRSLSLLIVKPEWSLKIIVADNDETPSARDLVETTAQKTGLSLTYIHAPARNISIARNACLDEATTQFVAFIDDDELVKPEWLMAMIYAIESSGTDVVLGPVHAIYDPGYPQWVRKGDFHSTVPVWVGEKIITGYSCNVLFNSRSPVLLGRRFRKELGRSGGEDTAFFDAVVKAGGRIAFAPEAIVTEAVTPERAKLFWLLKRRFRSGQTHGLLLLEGRGHGAIARSKNLIKAAGKLLYCFTLALANIVQPDRMRFWLLRGALHAGVVSRLLGKQEIEQYG